MTHDNDIILLAHGEGALATHRLIETVFAPHLANRFLDKKEDSAIIEVAGEKFAFTTDGFIIEPVFFPGGDIGKLAVCGTVNDLTAMGAKPLWLSASFIIEEGFPIAKLERIAKSFAETCKVADVALVAADTKVVPRGQGGQIYISAAGIGKVVKEVGLDKIRIGDEIVVSGDIASHATAILAARESIETNPPVVSDCAPLWQLVTMLLEADIEIHAMRDPTRGGLATTLVEISEKNNLQIQIDEGKIPINSQVQTLCDIYGFDPLYMANEGKMVFFVPPGFGERTINELKKHSLGKNASLIGSVSDGTGVIINTYNSGKRKLIMLEGEQLPRIC